MHLRNDQGNREVIAVNQDSSGNRQLFREDGVVAWVADVPHSRDTYLAVFNIKERSGSQTIKLADLGFSGPCRVRDLWRKKDLGGFDGVFAPEVSSHGAGLYRVRPL